jgi:hypothetical protein
MLNGEFNESFRDYIKLEEDDSSSIKLTFDILYGSLLQQDEDDISSSLGYPNLATTY